MSRRLKVLISAYACEPNKGSEPEVGWQWALQMARFHDVTVLTRANNQEAIERELEKLREKIPLPRFLYHEEDFLLTTKKRFNATKSYYVAWQRSAHRIVQHLEIENHFDLLHHITFAAYRYPTAIWNHGVPSIWGPIGGIESIPVSLLPWHHPKSLFHELIRNLHNSLQLLPLNVLPKRGRQSSTVLVSTREMQRAFTRLDIDSFLMPTIGLHLNSLDVVERSVTSGPLKLLFVGNIITLKGVDMALAALKNSSANATLTFIGDGNFLSTAKKIVVKLGLTSQVEFLGRMPRAEVLRMYSRYDVFLFPSLHDTGGYAVIEAMSKGLPVICLDCGGPAVAVDEHCGIKIPLGKRTEVVAGIAKAIQFYDSNRNSVLEHGKAARDAALRNYDWDKKGLQMNEIYQKTASENRRVWNKSISGAEFLRGLSLKGLFLSAAILFAIGIIGFLSIDSLKKKTQSIVRDTLPGLTYAGAANANLAQTFNRALLFLVTENPAERAKYKSEMDSFSQTTIKLLDQYKTGVFSREDLRNFNLLLERRNRYLELRDDFVRLAEENQRVAALNFYTSSLLPSYNEYRKAGEVLFDYNVREGQRRGEKITTICTITQWAVAGFVVVMFVIGFVMGFFR